MKHLIIILLIGCNCLFSPSGDCTVSIQTENPNYSYSFECGREDFNEAINTMVLNTPDVMEGNTITLGKCALKCVYEEGCLKVHLKQLTGNMRSYWGSNPHVLDITKRQYKKILSEYGLQRVEFDSVNVSVKVDNNK